MVNLPLTKKSLGQHWLNDEASLAAICQAAELKPSDTVLEIGPGPGSLTKLLVKQAKQVMAVEFDDQLALDLAKRVSAQNLQVVHEDILKFNFQQLPKGYKIVANIPYYLTNNLLRLISETSNQPALAVLLVQKEVAERVTATPGGMSLLSVTVQYYWQVSLGVEVPAPLFTPPPKVDSRVIILSQRPKPLFAKVNAADFFRLVKAGFCQRRKTLLNSLSAGLHYSRDETQAICERASIDCGRRAQSLSLEEWYRLYCSMHT